MGYMKDNAWSILGYNGPGSNRIWMKYEWNVNGVYGGIMVYLIKLTNLSQPDIIVGLSENGKNHHIPPPSTRFTGKLIKCLRIRMVLQCSGQMFRKIHMNMENDPSSCTTLGYSSPFFPEVDSSHIQSVGWIQFANVWPWDVHHLTSGFTATENWTCLYPCIYIYMWMKNLMCTYTPSIYLYIHTTPLDHQLCWKAIEEQGVHLQMSPNHLYSTIFMYVYIYIYLEYT